MQRGQARTLAAVLFTDMVDSTSIAEELGDRRWKALVNAHHRIVRRELKRFGGTEHDTAGDGFFASFKEPASAIACACAASEAVRELGVEIRAGIHFGECERIGAKLGGITVVIGARIMSLGGAGDVLVSSTAAELSRGAGFGFEDRGMQRLKGVDDEWRVFAATAVDGHPRPAPLEASLARTRRDEITPEAPRRRLLLPVAVALAVVVAAIAIPVGARRLHRGLPGLDADALGLIDPSNGHITAQISLDDAPDGVATGAGSTWVALEGTNQVARIDQASRTVTQRIDVQANPTGVAYDGGAVWVTNADARSVSWIDPASDKVVRTIEVGNAPSAIAAGEGAVWVTNTLDGTVTAIDPTDGGVVATIPVGADPVGIAIAAGSIWVVNQGSNQVARLEPTTGTVRHTVQVGAGPSAIAFDGTDLWVTNTQSGTIMRIDPTTNAITGTVPTGGAPTSLAAAGGSIWVGDEDTNTVARVDPSGGGRIAGTIVVGNAPRALAFDGDTLWMTSRASSASHQGGTLLVESSNTPGTIDPNASWDPFAYSILTNTNDGLLTYARVGGTAGSALVPDLATTIPEPTDRGTTYTFDLREGVRYSDGTALKPSDVVSSFERTFVLGAGPSFYLAPLRGADRCSTTSCDLSAGIQANDEAGTVTFHLTQPDPTFLDVLALPFLAIVPPSTPTRLIAEAPFVPATGPYMIRSYTPPATDSGQGVVELQRNPFFDEWSHAAQPAGYPEDIVIRFGLDLDRATTEVEQDQADVLLDTPSAARAGEIETRFAARSHPYTLIALTYLFLNTRVEPFTDPDVRRAVNYALDRTKLARTVSTIGLYGAEGAPTCQTLPPNVPGYAPYCPYSINGSSTGAPDLVKAQGLVDASGTKGARISVWSDPTFAATARYVAGVLDRLGYAATARTIHDTDTYFHHISDSSNRAQMGVSGWIADTPDAFGMLGFTVTCASFIPNDPNNMNSNYAEFCDPALDRQIERAHQLGTTDPPRANQLWHRIDRQIVDQGAWVPFNTPSGTILVSSRAGNVHYNPVLSLLLGQIWVQ